MTSPATKRRDYSMTKIEEMRLCLETVDHLLDDQAAIYATGSYGRLEANSGSDLDAFILTRTNGVKRELSRLDEILLKARLIETVDILQIDRFDGDGAYLQTYSAKDLLEYAGTPQDDALNTFTARMLLMLEGKPIKGEDIFNDAVGSVITHYWRDYADHSNNFLPAFFLNDILRLWRTFCVNYESNSKTEPNEEKIKRRYKNYKLKHSRIITCFSSIAYLAVLYRTENTVRPDKVVDMTRLTPLERLRWTATRDSKLEAAAEEAIDSYGQFLKFTDRLKRDILRDFGDRETFEARLLEAVRFGDAMAALVRNACGDTRIGRLMLI